MFIIKTFFTGKRKRYRKHVSTVLIGKATVFLLYPKKGAFSIENSPKGTPIRYQPPNLITLVGGLIGGSKGRRRLH